MLFVAGVAAATFQALKTLQQSNGVAIAATLVVSAISLMLIKRVSSRCRETSKHLRALRACLTVLPKGLRPAVAGMSTATAANLCDVRGDGGGETITLSQYMQLVKEVTEYAKVCDVTYIAKTLPSEWGTRKDLNNLKAKKSSGKRMNKKDIAKLHVLSFLWDDYFSDQITRKHGGNDIRMRRIFVFNDGCPSDQIASLEYLAKKHDEAKLALLIIDEEDLPKEYRRDLALIVCDNGSKWIIRSDYKPATSMSMVRTWIVSSVPDTDATSLFKTIDTIFDPEPHDPRLKARGESNRPDMEFLRKKCGLLKRDQV